MCGFQLAVLGLALGAILQMFGDFMHLHTADCAVQIRGKQWPDLCTRHDCASTSWPGFLTLRWGGTPREAPFAFPASALILRTNVSSRFFSASRPRIKRDLTVPREICKTSAISS